MPHRLSALHRCCLHAGVLPLPFHLLGGPTERLIDFSVEGPYMGRDSIELERILGGNKLQLNNAIHELGYGFPIPLQLL